MILLKILETNKIIYKDMGINWKNKKGELSSEEITILSILTMDSDPRNFWIKYKDLLSLSSLTEGDFKGSLDSLIRMGLIRLGNQGQGLTVALEDHISEFKRIRLLEVIDELEIELKKAVKERDNDMVRELKNLIEEKRNEV